MPFRLHHVGFKLGVDSIKLHLCRGNALDNLNRHRHTGVITQRGGHPIVFLMVLHKLQVSYALIGAVQ